MKKFLISSVKATYATLSLLYIVIFPYLIGVMSQAFPNSLIAKLSFKMTAYFFIVGILYLVSTIYAYRSKRIGYILGIIASYMGIIPWIGSILGAGYLVARKKWNQ
ncbi:MAG: hypothetical protein ABIJ41_08010 [Candidatus Omnitrophota bacterium]